MADTVYSKSSAASVKSIYDLNIMESDFRNKSRIDFRKESYLKQLIKLMSKGVIEVKPLTSGLQFFYLKGGAEGFLDKATYSGIDASHRVSGSGSTTSSSGGITMVFDDTNLLAVFDHRGNLISSALLQRPLSITVPPPPPAGFHGWSERAANQVVEAWDNCNVNLYHNAGFDVKYYGLQIDDSKDYYRNRQIMVDFHKQEATNGCIFIVDEDTPPYPDDTLPAAAQAAALAKLNDFEPQLIKDIQANVGSRAKYNLGKLRVIKMY